jgi:hypothetical protein
MNKGLMDIIEEYLPDIYLERILGISLIQEDYPEDSIENNKNKIRGEI